MASGARKRRELTHEQMEDIMLRLRELSFQGRRIRALHEDGYVWLVLADVLQALDYRVKASHIAKVLRPGEVELKDIGAKNALVNCINQTGLYAVTRFSNKPEAQTLYAWCLTNVFSEKQGDISGSSEGEEIFRTIQTLTKQQKRELLVYLRQLTTSRR